MATAMVPSSAVRAGVDGRTSVLLLNAFKGDLFAFSYGALRYKPASELEPVCGQARLASARLGIPTRKRY